MPFAWRKRPGASGGGKLGLLDAEHLVDDRHVLANLFDRTVPADGGRHAGLLEHVAERGPSKPGRRALRSQVSLDLCEELLHLAAVVREAVLPVVILEREVRDLAKAPGEE